MTELRSLVGEVPAGRAVGLLAGHANCRVQREAVQIPGRGACAGRGVGAVSASPSTSAGQPPVR
jgi:hypothetical protein